MRQRLGRLLLVGGVFCLGVAVERAGWLAPPHTAVSAPGPIDIGFSQHMALHHDQAVTLALMVRDRASPTVHALADGIAQSQLQEIGHLKGWLTLWRQPLLPTTRDMAWMVPQRGSTSFDPSYVDVCRSSPAGMPGLATQADLEALRQAQGSELDRLFLALMIRHHEGGAPMLAYAAEHAESEAVRQLAGRMGYEQRQEAVQLRARLVSPNGGDGLPR